VVGLHIGFLLVEGKPPRDQGDHLVMAGLVGGVYLARVRGAGRSRRTDDSEGRSVSSLVFTAGFFDPTMNFWEPPIRKA